MKYPIKDHNGITHFSKEIAYKDNRIYMKNDTQIIVCKRVDKLIVRDMYDVENILETNEHSIEIFRPVESQVVETKYIGEVVKDGN